MNGRFTASPDWLAPWWVWNPETAGMGDRVYRGFNLLEGLIWLGFSVLVLRRWFAHRRSMAEWSYALAFIVFGMTDFREAYAQSAWLVLVKGGVLAWLLALRHRATRIWYPGAKLY